MFCREKGLPAVNPQLARVPLAVTNESLTKVRRSIASAPNRARTYHHSILVVKQMINALLFRAIDFRCAVRGRGGWPGTASLPHWQLNVETHVEDGEEFYQAPAELCEAKSRCPALLELRISLQGRILPYPKSGW